ncbi:hypothetical protein V1477_010094 [Vespula maculifrons]|uniref:Uncharacterized protein n=1 Tax=Vespula maculifrons TaxID=7453 RepID=A0ABD2CCE7_VESMC
MQSEEILALRRRKFIRFFSFDKHDDSRERKRSGNELIAESEIGRQLLRSMTHDDYVQTLTTARQQIDIAPLPDELGGAISESVVGWKQLSGKCRRWWVFARCGKQKSNAKVKFTFRAQRPESPNLSTSVPKVNLSRFRTSVKSFPALRACKFPPAWFRSSRLYSHSPEADDGSAAGTGPPRRRNSLKEPEEAPSHLLNDIDL